MCNNRKLETRLKGQTVENSNFDELIPVGNTSHVLELSFRNLADLTCFLSSAHLSYWPENIADF